MVSIWNCRHYITCSAMLCHKHCRASYQQWSGSPKQLAFINRKIPQLHHVMVQEKSCSVPLPLLTATPRRVLNDEPIAIQGRYLPPRWPVTLRATMFNDKGELWEAHAYYCTDDSGTVDLTRDESEGGSYTGREQMGLFWSLKPVLGEGQQQWLRKTNVETPFTVELSILNGHTSQSMSSTDTCSTGGCGGEQLATVTVERWYMAPGVRRVCVREGGLVATLFLPPGPGPFPAVLDLWGLRGWNYEYRSSLLASRGIASLALAYVKHKELPGPPSSINVGYSYFQTAFQFLKSHPQVCEDRAGIISQCYGSHIGLYMATQMQLKPHCVVCVNGAVGCGYLFPTNGKTSDYGKCLRPYKHEGQDYVSYWEETIPQNSPPEYKAEIEKLHCPLLLIVSEDDHGTASILNADEIEKRLQVVGRSHLVRRVSYPGAGHLLEPPYVPNTHSNLYKTSPTKVYEIWGGHPAPHAAAQEDAWKKILEFLNFHLREQN